MVIPEEVFLSDDIRKKEVPTGDMEVRPSIGISDRLKQDVSKARHHCLLYNLAHTIVRERLMTDELQDKLLQLYQLEYNEYDFQLNDDDKHDFHEQFAKNVQNPYDREVLIAFALGAMLGGLNDLAQLDFVDSAAYGIGRMPEPVDVQPLLDQFNITLAVIVEEGKENILYQRLEPSVESDSTSLCVVNCDVAGHHYNAIFNTPGEVEAYQSAVDSSVLAGILGEAISVAEINGDIQKFVRKSKKIGQESESAVEKFKGSTAGLKSALKRIDEADGVEGLEKTIADCRSVRLNVDMYKNFGVLNETTPFVMAMHGALRALASKGGVEKVMTLPQSSSTSVKSEIESGLRQEGGFFGCNDEGASDDAKLAAQLQMEEILKYKPRP